MFNRNYRSCGCMNNDNEDYDYNVMATNLVNGSCDNNHECNKDSIYDNSCGCVNNANDDYMSECACGYNEPYNVFPTNPTIAESYVPRQYFDRAFKSCIGLKKGTIFPELVSTYEPCQSMKEIEYLKSTNKIGEGCNE